MNVVDFFATPARQGRVLRETGHRPWPLPDRDGWRMAQTWERLLFAHWPAPAEAVREHVPSELPLDTFERTAWDGITPFRLRGLRLRGTPPAPFISSFLELNARTYVTVAGKPGIWFFSLDASSRLAVEAARRAYRLPYFRARMSPFSVDGAVRFASERVGRGGRPAAFSARYEPLGDSFTARAGSLEHFLAERYCLYAADRGRLFRAEIHHGRWPLQRAEAGIERSTMAPPGIDTGGPPLLHFAARQDVVIWPLEPLEARQLARSRHKNRSRGEAVPTSSLRGSSRRSRTKPR